MILFKFCPGKLMKGDPEDRPDNIESAIAWLDYCTFLF